MADCYITRGGGSGGLKMELLWENASPTSSFVPQTITLDLSDYSFVVIPIRAGVGATDWESTDTVILETADSKKYVLFLDGIKSEYSRNISVNSNGVEFKEGKRGSSTSTTVCVPKRIYGIKGVS